MAEIQYRISHDNEGQPVMLLFHRLRPDGPKGLIPLRDAWRFSEDHNPFFEDQIAAVTIAAHHHIYGHEAHLYPSKHSMARKMAEIATTIENGLDALLNARPETPDPGRVVGEGKASINGYEIKFEFTDKGKVHV